MLLATCVGPTGLALLSLLHRTVAAASYNLVKDHTGTTFFDDWIFYDHFDNLTNGDAIFVSASTASSKKLAFVDSSTNHAFIKVDNSTTVPFGEKRNTVRIASKDRYTVGSVWVTDMYHVPYGCSVWPAWWSSALEWPRGGEIDTFEGVNMVSHSQMGLHTTTGCNQDSPVQSSTLVNSTNCDNLANNNLGCVVTNPSSSSYGPAFSAAGGGVFVTEFAASGISIWFFERKSVPSMFASNSSSIDTSTLGTPIANWPARGCDVNQFFEAQSLVLDITLCGDFAGTPSVFSQTCRGICYDDYVVGPPSNYDNAYFELGYVRVYGAGNTVILGSGATSLTSRNSYSLLLWVVLLSTPYLVFRLWDV